MSTRRMERTQCQCPKRSLGSCKRLATRFYLDGYGHVFRAYCTAHADGAGVARLLRPLPWEYSRIVDRHGRTVTP